jgi:hypothetical protein
MNWKHGLVTASVALNVGLLVYLVMGPGHPPILISESFGQNRAVAGGGYAATTANVTSNRQALWLIDNREKRMIVYLFPGTRGHRLEPIAARDLRKDFGEDLAGELICIPGQLPGAEEGVYVLDPVGKKLIVYYSRNGKDLEVIGSRDLGKDFRE